MSELFGGFYVAAEGQLGAYHPWHLGLYRWLPFGAAFDVELLASYPLAFAGMYLLLRRTLGRRDAASLGALAFTFCGFNLLHFVHPNAIAIVAHLPWLLWTIGIALTTSHRRHEAAALAGIALLTASQLLLGYPQYVWFSLLAEGAYVLWHLATRRASLGRAGLVGLAVALGVVIGAIQWIPTWHALATSVRHTPDAAFANSGSLHPLNLVQLLAPYLFATRVVGQNTHELGLYLGAVPLMLCAWLAASVRHETRALLPACATGGLPSSVLSSNSIRPIVRPLAIGGAVALLLAAGEYGGVYRIQSLLPLVNRFRFPCRAIVLVELVAAVLAAIAFALLADRSRVGCDDQHEQRHPASPQPRRPGEHRRGDHRAVGLARVRGTVAVGVGRAGVDRRRRHARQAGVRGQALGPGGIGRADGRRSWLLRPELFDRWPNGRPQHVRGPSFSPARNAADPRGRGRRSRRPSQGRPHAAGGRHARRRLRRARAGQAPRLPQAGQRAARRR